jgi:hypothetical protein
LKDACDRAKRLKDAFRDDAVLEALKGKLEEGRITDGDIQTLINGGGMTMEEEQEWEIEQEW